jgi:hypothetical protein
VAEVGHGTLSSLIIAGARRRALSPTGVPIPVTDILYALQMWLLLGLLTTWFAARAATRLRCQPRCGEERAEYFGWEEDGPPQRPYEPGEIRRALRIYDCA